MIDPKTLMPMVKKLLPDESDADIMAGIKEFAKAHPDFNNAQALQALIDALKQMQGGGQQAPAAGAAPAQPAPQQAPFEGLMGQLGSK